MKHSSMISTLRKGQQPEAEIDDVIFTRIKRRIRLELKVCLYFPSPASPCFISTFNRLPVPPLLSVSLSILCSCLRPFHVLLSCLAPCPPALLPSCFSTFVPVLSCMLLCPVFLPSFLPPSFLSASLLSFPLPCIFVSLSCISFVLPSSPPHCSPAPLHDSSLACFPSCLPLFLIYPTACVSVFLPSCLPPCPVFLPACLSSLSCRLP